MKKLVIPATEGCGYRRPAYKIEYSTQLYRDGGKVRTGVTQDKAREIAKAKGIRLSTAAELQVLGERGLKDAAFNDYSGFWELTDTNLLKPKGRKRDYKQSKSGSRYRLRLVAEGVEEDGKPRLVGELWVPEGNRRVVRAWSPFGIPAERGERGNGWETHFYFNPDLDYIVLARDRYWRDSRGDFSLYAYLERGRSDSNLGFRPVRGPLPTYEKIAA